MDDTPPSLLCRVRDPSDAESWREFTDLYQPLLLSYVHSCGLQYHDARDVVQDVFQRLLKVLPGFELDPARGKFRTWLWQVTMSALTDWSRREQRQARITQEWAKRFGPAEAWSEREPEAEWLSAHHRRVVDFVLQQVRAEAVPTTWQCFELRVLRVPPRSAGEIAAQLGITDTAVYMNAMRILKRVRERCAEYLEDLGHE